MSNPYFDLLRFFGASAAAECHLNPELLTVELESSLMKWSNPQELVILLSQKKTSCNSVWSLKYFHKEVSKLRNGSQLLANLLFHTNNPIRNSCSESWVKSNRTSRNQPPYKCIKASLSSKVVLWGSAYIQAVCHPQQAPPIQNLSKPFLTFSLSRTSSNL